MSETIQSETDRAAYRSGCTRRRQRHLIQVLVDGQWQTIYDGSTNLSEKQRASGARGINAAKRANRGRGGYAD